MWSHVYVSADRYPQIPAGTRHPGAGLTGRCKPPPWLLETVPSSLWSGVCSLLMHELSRLQIYF